MSLLRVFVSSFGVAAASAALAGDPVPAQYPVVNVHVPEPVGSTHGTGAAATELRMQALSDLEQRQATVERTVARALQSLSLKIDNVAAAVGKV